MQGVRVLFTTAISILGNQNGRRTKPPLITAKN